MTEGVRFWRDLGYAIGALVTGAVADWIGIPWSIGVTAILVALSAILILICYKEIPAGSRPGLNEEKTVDSKLEGQEGTQVGPRTEMTSFSTLPPLPGSTGLEVAPPMMFVYPAGLQYPATMMGTA
eukprot:759209-Hanusia_phi.AAC.3